MQNPFMSAAFKPDLAFTGAAERFFELLKSFSLPGAGAAGAAGAAPDWSAIAGSLAGQFEQWLKSSQSAGPWFTAADAPGPGAGFAAAAAALGPYLPRGTVRRATPPRRDSGARLRPAEPQRSGRALRAAQGAPHAARRAD